MIGRWGSSLPHCVTASVRIGGTVDGDVCAPSVWIHVSSACLSEMSDRAGRILCNVLCVELFGFALPDDDGFIAGRTVQSSWCKIQKIQNQRGRAPRRSAMNNTHTQCGGVAGIVGGVVWARWMMLFVPVCVCYVSILYSFHSHHAKVKIRAFD